MPPAEPDHKEFTAMIRRVDTITTKQKRQIYSAIRDGMPMETLRPRLGLTFGEITSGLVIREKY